MTFFLLQNAPSCEWLGNHNWSFKTGTNKLTFVFQNAPSCEWLGRDNETYNMIICDIGNPLPSNGQVSQVLTTFQKLFVRLTRKYPDCKHD